MCEDEWGVMYELRVYGRYIDYVCMYVDETVGWLALTQFPSPPHISPLLLLCVSVRGARLIRCCYSQPAVTVPAALAFLRARPSA